MAYIYRYYIKNRYKNFLMAEEKNILRMLEENFSYNLKKSKVTPDYIEIRIHFPFKLSNTYRGFFHDFRDKYNVNFSEIFYKKKLKYIFFIPIDFNYEDDNNQNYSKEIYYNENNDKDYFNEEDRIIDLILEDDLIEIEEYYNECLKKNSFEEFKNIISEMDILQYKIDLTRDLEIIQSMEKSDENLVGSYYVYSIYGSIVTDKALTNYTINTVSDMDMLFEENIINYIYGKVQVNLSDESSVKLIKRNEIDTILQKEILSSENIANSFKTYGGHSNYKGEIKFIKNSHEMFDPYEDDISLTKSDEYNFTVWDTGQGLCTMLDNNKGENIFFDFGGSKASEQCYIKDKLRETNIIILSHKDKDHWNYILDIYDAKDKIWVMAKDQVNILSLEAHKLFASIKEFYTIDNDLVSTCSLIKIYTGDGYKGLKSHKHKSGLCMHISNDNINILVPGDQDYLNIKSKGTQFKEVDYLVATHHGGCFRGKKVIPLPKKNVETEIIYSCNNVKFPNTSKRKDYQGNGWIKEHITRDSGTKHISFKS